MKVQEDMLLVSTACKALSVVGREKIDINSENPPFKINPEDEVFQSLLEIMSVNFFKNVHYYSNAVSPFTTFVYKVGESLVTLKLDVSPASHASLKRIHKTPLYLTYLI